MLRTGTLNHGGIMVTYQCNAACRHCLYSCSPTRGAGYVDSGTMKKICAYLRKGGCKSVHIGGGEPFLDFDGLIMVIRKLKGADIKLEYIETNAHWIPTDMALKPVSVLEDAQRKLDRLMTEGVRTLCISVDPYHAEYVPYASPVALAELCEKTGMGYFLWKQEFLPLMSRLDSKKAHPRAAMEKALSREYVQTTARAYGIGYGGRAVNIEQEFGTSYPIEHLASENAPCRNLLSTGHFHVDMFCYFIPPGCTGIRIPLPEAVDGFTEDKYQVFRALYSGGVSALLEMARQHGFSPAAEGYSSKCNLCFHLRRFLAGKDFPELDKGHYEEALKYYNKVEPTAISPALSQ